MCRIKGPNWVCVFRLKTIPIFTLVQPVYITENEVVPLSVHTGEPRQHPRLQGSIQIGYHANVLRHPHVMSTMTV